MKKHTKQIAAFLMVFAVVLVAGCAERMTAEEIAARMKAQEESIKDFSAMVVTTISLDGNDTTILCAEVMGKMPDKDRAEFIEPANITGRIMLRNGSTMWTYDPATNQATKTRLSEDEPSEIDYTGFIKDLMNETDISYEGIENVDGRNAYVILVMPHDETDRDKPISRTRAWIDCKDWMPLRMEMYGEEDKRNISVKIEFDDITFNTGIPDDVFMFEVPEGVEVVSEDGVPGGAPEAVAPDAAQPAPASEAITASISAPLMITNWKYIGYRNLSISNAPALNQTARITYSIIPDRDIEDLLVCVSIPDGFKFVDVEGERLLTWGKNKTPYRNLERCARWRPTNLSKGKMYQFSATIKAVKTGNWTIARDEHTNAIYLSVSEDSAYISDEPFPYIPRFISRSQFEKELAEQNMTLPPPRPSKYNLTPRPLNISDVKGRPPQDFHLSNFYWNGTTWVEGREPVMNNQS